MRHFTPICFLALTLSQSACSNDVRKDIEASSDADADTDADADADADVDTTIVAIQQGMVSAGERVNLTGTVATSGLNRSTMLQRRFVPEHRHSLGREYCGEHRQT